MTAGSAQLTDIDNDVYSIIEGLHVCVCVVAASCLSKQLANCALPFAGYCQLVADDGSASNVLKHTLSYTHTHTHPQTHFHVHV